MLDFDPTESAGFLVGRVAHALTLRVQEFLDEAGIDLFAEEISILTVLAHFDGPERMKSLAEGVCVVTFGAMQLIRESRLLLTVIDDDIEHNSGNQ